MEDQMSGWDFPTLRVEIVLRADPALLEIVRQAVGVFRRTPTPAPADDGGPAAEVAHDATAAGPDVEQDTGVGAAPAGAMPCEDGGAEAPDAAVEGTAADAPLPPLAPQPAGEPRAPAALPKQLNPWHDIRARRWDAARIAELQALWQVRPSLGRKVLAERISAAAPHLDVLTMQQVSAEASRLHLPMRDWDAPATPAAAVAASPPPAVKQPPVVAAPALVPLSTPSRSPYDLGSESLRDGRVVCDAARVAAYAARYDLPWDGGDMRPINLHRRARAWPEMSLYEPALLPPGLEYPVRA
jgi:hypothetical protein